MDFLDAVLVDGMPAAISQYRDLLDLAPELATECYSTSKNKW
jgi:hypothetical protein